VLLGALSKLSDVEEKFWLSAIERMVPAKTLEVNRKAFELGRNSCR
jgi:indolepyruvate ferredoxin oxidoreductase beta subunit